MKKNHKILTLSKFIKNKKIEIKILDNKETPTAYILKEYF